MGRESVCLISHRGNVVEAKALLETEEIIIRGALKLRIPFGAVRAVEIADSELVVYWADGPTTFGLGQAESARWVQKIRNPRTLLDKLGISAATRLAMVGIADPDFEAIHEQQLGTALQSVPIDSAEIVIFRADKPEQLAQISELRSALGDRAALWVVTPKKTAGLMDTDVMAVAKAAGLVDNKVVRFSATHTALRFVVPIATRRTVKT